jgi:predicted amidohydrolase YtcJ
MRVYLLYSVNTVNQTKRAVKHLTKGGNDFLKLGGLKIFLDGSGMARTAWMYEDWNKNFTNKDGNNRGYTVIPAKEFRVMVNIAHKAGFQIGVHAIGDRAIDETIYAYEAALKDYPKNNSRHSIIHANIPTERARAYTNLPYELAATYPLRPHPLSMRLYPFYCTDWSCRHSYYAFLHALFL